MATRNLAGFVAIRLVQTYQRSYTDPSKRGSWSSLLTLQSNPQPYSYHHYVSYRNTRLKSSPELGELTSYLQHDLF